MDSLLLGSLHKRLVLGQAGEEWATGAVLRAACCAVESAQRKRKKKEKKK